jgi:hypothetical protein
MRLRELTPTETELLVKHIIEGIRKRIAENYSEDMVRDAIDKMIVCSLPSANWFDFNVNLTYSEYQIEEIIKHIVPNKTSNFDEWNW